MPAALILDAVLSIAVAAALLGGLIWAITGGARLSERPLQAADAGRSPARSGVERRRRHPAQGVVTER